MTHEPSNGQPDRCRVPSFWGCLRDIPAAEVWAKVGAKRHWPRRSLALTAEAMWSSSWFSAQGTCRCRRPVADLRKATLCAIRFFLSHVYYTPFHVTTRTVDAYRFSSVTFLSPAYTGVIASPVCVESRRRVEEWFASAGCRRRERFTYEWIWRSSRSLSLKKNIILMSLNENPSDRKSTPLKSSH